jgi:replicative DNA helicase
MVTQESFEKIIFHFAFSNPKYIEALEPSYLRGEHFQKIVPIVKDFYKKYISKPSKFQLSGLLNSVDIEIPEIELNDLYEINLSEYSEEWLQENYESFIRLKKYQESLVNTSGFLRTQNIYSDNTVEILEKAHTIMSGGIIHNFDENSGMFFTEAEKHKDINLSRISTGYNFVDLSSNGGFYRKSLNVLLGQSGVGKTLWMSNFAANYMLAGYNVAYITCELPDAMIAANVGANVFNVDINTYDAFANDIPSVLKELNKLQKTSMHPIGKMYIKEFPSGSASVLDIEADLKKQEIKGDFKFDAVIIDYIGILRDYRSSKTDNSYTQIRNIAIDLRAMASKNLWVVISASQINRDGMESSDIAASHVRESIALIDNCDFIFGILQDPFMKSSGQYILKCIKARRGQGANWRKQFLVDYQYMRIVENMSEQIDKNALF